MSASTREKKAPEVKRWAEHNFKNSVKSMMNIERGKEKGKPWRELYDELKEMKDD